MTKELFNTVAYKAIQWLVVGLMFVVVYWLAGLMLGESGKGLISSFVLLGIALGIFKYLGSKKW